MKKKALLLTFSFNYNYGGLLQAYATIKALNKLDIDVFIPVYVPQYVKGNASFFRGLGIRNGNPISRIYKRAILLNRYLRFDSFRSNNFSYDKKLDTLSAIKKHINGYDYVITGSDQAWNTNWYNEFDDYFFQGFFQSNSKTKKVSYAACFGSEKQNLNFKDQASRCLNNYDSISVRNNISQNIVHEYIGIMPEVVADPTVLHEFDELKNSKWNESLNIILVYSLDEDNIQVGKAISLKLKSMTGCRVVFINSERSLSIDWADKVYNDKGPAEWVELFYRAKYIVTDSFHGCVFAAKFGKKFIPYTTGWRADRITSFLELIGLNDLLILDNNLPESFSNYWDDVDYNTVRNRIIDMKNKSLDFIKRSIK